MSSVMGKMCLCLNEEIATRKCWTQSLAAQEAKISMWIWRNCLTVITEEPIDWNLDDEEIIPPMEPFEEDKYHSEDSISTTSESESDVSTIQTEAVGELPVYEDDRDPFKFDYSYDRHDGPIYVLDEYDYAEKYLEDCLGYEGGDESEPDEEVIDR